MENVFKRFGMARCVAAIVLPIPIVIWMLFGGPDWLWRAFIFSAFAMGGYEIIERLKVGDGSKPSGTVRRVVTVVPLIPVVIWMMFWGPHWLWHAFILSGIAMSGYEMVSMSVPKSITLRLWGGLSSTIFACAVIFSNRTDHLFSAVLFLIFSTIVLDLLVHDSAEDVGRDASWLLTTPFYVGGTLCTVDLVRDFPPTGAWVLLSMMFAWLSDTFAYFFGRKFGKTQLAPYISPKKTIEGSIGGLCGSMIGALLMSVFIAALPLLDAIALGMIAGVAGQAGDLLESSLKRSAGVKDSGGILPGHGGILDRVDALMLAASVTWMYGTFIAGFSVI